MIRSCQHPHVELVALAEKYKASCDATALVLEGMDFLSSEDRRGKRKDNLAKQYMVDKLARQLQSGGHSKTLARHMSRYLQSQVARAGAAITFEQPALLNSGDDFSIDLVNSLGQADGAPDQTWPHFMQWWRESLGEHLERKVAEMVRTMQKKDWKSAMSKFDNIVTKEVANRYPFGEAADDLATDPGAGVWLVGLKANAFRVGPENIAMLGLPMFILAMEQNLCVVCHKVAFLLGQGIVLNDLAGFLESPSSGEYLKEQCYTLKVGPGEVAFVPAGYVSTVTYYAAAREQETSNPYAFYMSYTMWAPAPAANLEPNVWQAIAGYNTKFFDTVATSRVFSSRAALMTRFMKVVSETDSTS